MNEQAPTPKNTLETGIDTASVEVKIADLKAKEGKIEEAIALEEKLTTRNQDRIDELLFKLRAVKKTLNELGGDLDFTVKPAELIDDDTARRLEEAGRQGL